MGTMKISLLFVALLAFGADAAAVETCPGAGQPPGVTHIDTFCNHSYHYRVCARLLDTASLPLPWGRGDYWEVSNQSANNWANQIRANGGDSWCTCVFMIASLIKEVGCNSVHVRCGATDWQGVYSLYSQYTSNSQDFSAAIQCLTAKCPLYA